MWTQPLLEKAGIEVHKTNRGGDITYHGPGQLVGYPIISLRARPDLHAYLRSLEEVIIQTIADFGLTGERRAGKTGIWLGHRKIAAIGIAVKGWITYHGFALNVSTDLNHFSGIVPCGITDGTVTSMERECGAPPTMTAVKAAVARHFEAQFSS